MGCLPGLLAWRPWGLFLVPTVKPHKEDHTVEPDQSALRQQCVQQIGDVMRCRSMLDKRTPHERVGEHISHIQCIEKM